MKIHSFSDFCDALSDCGFSMGGGNAKGIYSVIPYGWEQQDNIDSPVKWHTGNPETDPWEWRMRVLEERKDIAYSKVFFRASGFITKDWYEYFYAVRRRGYSFEEAYADGMINRNEKRIYEVILENGETAFHEVKQLCGFSGEESSKFEQAVIDLQMKMYITICGRSRRINRRGEAYGWNSTVFTTVEDFWQARGHDLKSVSPELAYNKIMEKVYSLNPNAKLKTADRFIRG
ncbi:MAG: hypothetical protein PHD46_02420 [Eubacteriales bacterium]|mgnify:FL=1|nr:hypothetical protein [Eubacteriales bacterium]MDD4421871.1 hypothetical protein [Eubacteriales bacterium]